MKTLQALVAVLILLAFLKAAAVIVVPLLLAITIATSFQPITERLDARGVPPFVASVLTIVCVLGALAGVGYLLVMAARDLSESAPGYAAQIGAARIELLGWLEGQGLGQVSTGVEEINVSEHATSVVGDAVVTASAVVGDLLNILVLTAFIQVEAHLLKKKLPMIMARSSVESTLTAIHEVQRYLRVKVLLALLNGVLLGGWCALWGLSNPILWGVVAFALNFVPIIGSLIAAIPPVLLSIVELGWGGTLAIAGGYLAVNIAIDNVLEARLMGRALGISPLVLMVSLLVWGFVLGPVGALLSVPITVAVRIYCDHHEKTRWIGLLLANGTRGYADLKPAAPDQGSAGPT